MEAPEIEFVAHLQGGQQVLLHSGSVLVIFNLLDLPLYRVHACTDVTGFSFLGHASEMATGSDVQLEINTAAIDLIPAALDFARMGILPAGMYRNRTFAEPMVDAGNTELAVQDVLYDPQTAGGLLIACDPEDADALFTALKPAVPSAQRVGTVQPYAGSARIYLK